MISFDNQFPRPAGKVPSGEDLDRELYCILGMPVDNVSSADVIRCIHHSAQTKTPLFLSTPNLNFFNTGWRDPAFHKSLLCSDLCPPDGMPVVWLSRLLGVPMRQRIAGSDILALLREQRTSRPLELFFFGGDEGVAEAAAKIFNEPGNGARCIGWIYPGFHPVADMSSDEIVGAINDSGADFLVVALGARKGQAWLMHNAGRLRIPVRAHFGASLNFEAGRLKRAPKRLQQWGMEWLWRIKEEPYLWRRYLDDGLSFLHALWTYVAPLVGERRLAASRPKRDFAIHSFVDESGVVTVTMAGPATIEHIDRIIAEFSTALKAAEKITIDMSAVTTVDPRFLGLLIIFRRKVERARLGLAFVGISADLKWQFQRHKSEFLVAPQAAEAFAPEANERRALSAAAS